MVAARRAAYIEEWAEVEVLFASLDKMKSLTKKIEGSMARLDASGRTVQEAIGPVYGNTQRLQTTTSNVDRVLEAIEKIKAPLDMRDREERIIRSRPDRVGLAEYISSIDRTNQALRDLKATNMRSNQQAIAELNDLLQEGTARLEGVFRDMCRQDSQPIEPLKQITTGSEFPRISGAKSAQLRTINAHISGSNATSSSGELTQSAQVYAHERGQYIMLSLQNLATASISTARKVSADAVYKQGSNAIGSYAQGIRGMYVAEYDNICPIFTREQWGPVLKATCQSSLTAFTSTLRELDKHVRNNLDTDCYLAYEIIDVVSKTSIQLEDRTGELKYPLSDALKPVRETARSSLSTFLTEIRTKIQQMMSLPIDGSAVPITAETMTRLQLMALYLPPLSNIMRSLGDGGWSAPSAAASSNSVPTLKSFDVGADGKELFAHYCLDMVETLLSSLDSRARTLLRGKGLQGVFMANNIIVVERMIRSSDLQTMLASVQGKLDGLKKKAEAAYMETWNETARLLFDSLMTSKQARPPSTGQAIDSATVLKSLNSKDKDGIKEKFKNFNTGFDDLVNKHKAYRMEAEVRRMLAQAVQRQIEPLYIRWWDRYHEVDKGKGKYVKYDKAQMSGILAGLS